MAKFDISFHRRLFATSEPKVNSINASLSQHKQIVLKEATFLQQQRNLFTPKPNINKRLIIIYTEYIFLLMFIVT
jgi:hypothetical protein